MFQLAKKKTFERKEGKMSLVRCMAPRCYLRPTMLSRIQESSHDPDSISQFAVLIEFWNFWFSFFSFVSLHLLKLALVDVSTLPQLASGPRWDLTRIDCLPVHDYSKDCVLLARSNHTNADPLRIWYFQAPLYPMGSLQVCYEELRKLYPVALALVMNLVSQVDMR